MAVQALRFIAADPDRLGRFLATTGIGPHEIRAAAHEPLFLAGVLDHIASDESLLLAFAADMRIEPEIIAGAHVALGGRIWERDAP